MSIFHPHDFDVSIVTRDLGGDRHRHAVNVVPTEIGARRPLDTLPVAALTQMLRGGPVKRCRVS